MAASDESLHFLVSPLIPEIVQPWGGGVGVPRTQYTTDDGNKTSVATAADGKATCAPDEEPKRPIAATVSRSLHIIVGLLLRSHSFQF